MGTYDETTELLRYMRRWYRHLFTLHERHGPTNEWLKTRVPEASIADIDFVRDGCYVLAPQSRRHTEQLLEAFEEFDAAAANRILREHSGKVFLNRCPQCERIVVSPLAKQCLWCSHDWHSDTTAAKDASST